MLGNSLSRGLHTAEIKNPMKKSKIILFNYGGGLRGLIPAQIMARIEEKTGLHMTDMIDIFSGPSTGAILNASLNVPSESNPNKPKFRARHLVRFYEREGRNIFPPDRFRDFRGFIHDFNNRTMKIGQLNKLLKHGHYNPAHLSKCLRDLFGEHNLADTIKSLVIPIFTIEGAQLQTVQEKGESADAPVHRFNNLNDGSGHAVWLKNIKEGLNLKPAPRVKLQDAVLASTAAPSYFPCHHFSAADSKSGAVTHYTGIDGSIFDNPCISYHGAIKRHIEPEAHVIMIQLGTGNTQRSYKKDEWNSFGGLGVVDPVNDLPLINILFQAPESALVESFAEEIGDDLYMFNKSIIKTEGGLSTPSTAIDDGSPENLKKMKMFAEEILEDNATEFDKVCNLLVKNYELPKEKPRGFWSRMFG
jgi:patatin-like phospholipase/acyl hydrolase